MQLHISQRQLAACIRYKIKFLFLPDGNSHQVIFPRSRQRKCIGCNSSVRTTSQDFFQYNRFGIRATQRVLTEHINIKRTQLVFRIRGNASLSFCVRDVTPCCSRKQEGQFPAVFPAITLSELWPNAWLMMAVAVPLDSTSVAQV